MPALVRTPAVAERKLMDQRLKSFTPEQREHFRESVHHNREILKRLSKM